jgi:hypothetical protein
VKYITRACDDRCDPRQIQCERKVDQRIALDVGQLVKDEYFTLFESIGALEVRLPSRAVTLMLTPIDHGPENG